MMIAFPMVSNGYALGSDAGFQGLYSPFLEIESQSLAKIFLSVSLDLVEDICRVQAIKSNTPEPEMFQAKKTCALSMIYAWFHRHSDNNHSFMRAMKNALATLSGLLANRKDTLNTLKIIQKKIIEPAKKMNLKIDWEDAVRRYSDQSWFIFATNQILHT